MTIARTGPQPLAVDVDAAGLSRWARMLVPAAELAATIADTDFVPEALRGNPAAVTAVILYGDELGIGPMQALQSIDVIKGKPQPSAALVRALIYRDGHSFLIHEATGVRCRVSGLRRGRPEVERVYVEWTLDMARAAGLAGSIGWQRYPRAFLMARSTTELGRQVFPDVMRGLGGISESGSTAEELQEWQPDAAPPPAPEPVQRRPRKRATKKAPAVAPTPDAHPVTGSQQAPPAEDDRPPVAPPLDAPAEAEPPAEEPAPPPPKMAGEALLRGYHASFRQAGIDTADRELRLAVTSYVVGRQVDSSKELTRAEALKVTGALAEVATGAASIEWDSDGQVVIRSQRQPPPADDALPLGES